jgi:hypothetical protein
MKLAGFRVDLETMDRSIGEEDEVLIDAAVDDLNIEEMRQAFVDYLSEKMPKYLFKKVAVKVYEE